MPFPKPANFVDLPSPVNPGLPRSYSALPMGTPRYGSASNQLSNGIGEKASELHRLDLERLARRTETESQFRHMLAHLKEQIEWKAAGCTRQAASTVAAEVLCRAS
jgi:hypothetical protein